MNRREFISQSTIRILKWTPFLAALGFRFHPYAAGCVAGFRGWVTFCGRLVGFVPR